MLQNTQQLRASSCLQQEIIEIPVTGVRKAIAANMLRSKHEIPHAWTMVEVDATNLVALS